MDRKEGSTVKEVLKTSAKIALGLVLFGLASHVLGNFLGFFHHHDQ